MEYVAVFILGMITGGGLISFLVMIGMREMQKSGRMVIKKDV